MIQLVKADPPRRGRSPGSAAALVSECLRKSTEPMRPVDVAKNVGITTQRAANTLRLLCDSGEVRRIRHPGITNGPGASLYVWAEESTMGRDGLLSGTTTL